MEEYDKLVKELGFEDCPQATGRAWAYCREILIKANTCTTKKTLPTGTK